jgi:PGM1 C-terminal domain
MTAASTEAWVGLGERVQSTRFARVQRRMAAVDDAAGARAEQRLILVVPSRTIDRWDEPPAEAQAYEERMLSSLFELGDPSLRMIYVTSSPVEPAIVDYHLSLLPRGLGRRGRRRLSLIGLSDRSSRPLSEKLLERPGVLDRIRAGLRDTDVSHLVTYNAGRGERDLALALDLPLYGTDPRHAHLGTKSGSRELFAQAGIPHPLGVEHLTSRSEVVNAIAHLRMTKPSLNELVVKLNNGVSGEGNSIVSLRGLPAPGTVDELSGIAERLEQLRPAVGSVGAAAFLAKLATGGGVVEERITGRELRSPSVQFRIAPGGVIELLSTHDQILDGPSGQHYRGCRFPADPGYAPRIGALARGAAQRLADIGVIGRFAIDFVVVRGERGQWEPFAIELNLRTGGTTHPYQTLVHLVDGRYDPATASFTTANREQRHYVASDFLEDDRLRTLGRDRVLELARGELRFDRARGVGTVFHMLGPMNELGRLGITAIGDSADHASALYDRARRALTTESVASGPGAARGRRRLAA